MRRGVLDAADGMVHGHYVWICLQFIPQVEPGGNAVIRAQLAARRLK